MMKKIRFVEEEIAKSYIDGKMRCPTHLSIGQELVGGLIHLFLKKTDYAVGTHRSHAHYLGKGGNLNALISELYGKVTGCSAGRGGSMHLIDKNVGFMGTTAIVGGNIPIGTGLSLSLKLDNSNNISCIFIGDGSIEEGVFYESINFCAVKQTPALFVCENNDFSVYSPLQVRQPSTRKLYKMVEGLGIKSFFTDSTKVNKSIDIFNRAINFVRGKKLPAFIEISSFRWKEHCGPNNDDELKYRSNKYIYKKRKHDPLLQIENSLIKNKILDILNKKKIEDTIRKEISRAFKFAEFSDFPLAEEDNKNEFEN